MVASSIHTYIYIHTHTHIYIYIYVHMHICVTGWEYISYQPLIIPSSARMTIPSTVNIFGQETKSPNISDFHTSHLGQCSYMWNLVSRFSDQTRLSQKLQVNSFLSIRPRVTLKLDIPLYPRTISSIFLKASHLVHCLGGKKTDKSLLLATLKIILQCLYTSWGLKIIV